MTTQPSNGLLLDIYGAAQDAGRWRGALDQLCSRMGVRSAVVQMLDHDGDLLRPSWTARDSLSLENAAVHDKFVNNDANPRLRLPVSPLQPRSILRDRDRFPSGSSELARFRERLSAAGLGEAIGVGIKLSATRSFALQLHRSRDDARAFDATAESFLLELAPHLEQAARLADAIDRSQLERDTMRDVLHGLRTGVIVCDRERQIHWMNAAAQAILETSADLRVARGRLCCADKDETQSLAGLITDAERRQGMPSSGAALAVGREGDSPLHVLAFRAEFLEEGRSAPPRERDRIAVVLSGPGHAPTFSATDVAALFGLSAAEARLSMALCRGETVNEYAQGRGISPGTARVQLKHVLAKTRTRRQSELVRHICGSVIAQVMST